MTELNYQKRELDHYFRDIRNDLTDIKAQVRKTNGTVLWHTKIILVFGTALGVLLITNGSEVIKLFKLII